MNSRAIKVYNYRDVPLDKEIIVKGVEEKVDSLIRSIVKHYKTKIQADSIESGDIVVLKCESETPKFNKPQLPLTVQKGLFDQSFEDAIIGLKMDEEKDIKVNDVDVKVKVMSITRTQYPELTDDMVKEYITDKDEKYGDIHSACEYIDKIRKDSFEELKEQEIYSVINYICVEVFEKSEWDFDQQELKDYAQNIIDVESQYLKQEGIDVETLESEDDFMRAFGDIHSRQELENVVATTSRDTIAMYLMACDWQNLRPEDIDIYNEDEAPTIVELLYDYIKNAIQFVEER